MPLRHYTGTPRPVAAAWVCPTCRTENTGPLEAGCANPQCKTRQQPARHVDRPVGAGKVPPPPAPVPATAGVYDGGRVSPWCPDDPAYRAWLAGWTPDPARRELDVLLYDAWQAGVAHGRAEAGAHPHEPLDGPEPAGPHGYRLSLSYFSEPEQEAVEEPVDAKTVATICAALAFYRDNALGYGDLPGQLSAQEVTELLQKLQPEELQK